jgi:hypothetical protein
MEVAALCGELLVSDEAVWAHLLRVESLNSESSRHDRRSQRVEGTVEGALVLCTKPTSSLLVSDKAVWAHLFAFGI